MRFLLQQLKFTVYDAKSILGACMDGTTHCSTLACNCIAQSPSSDQSCSTEVN